MRKYQRQKELIEAIRTSLSSLDSHLDWTYGKSKDGASFHKKTALEYAEQLVILIKRL